MNMILRVIAVFLMAVSVASADEHLRASKPKDCYLFSFGKGPDWSAKVAVEFRLSYLERKQPVVDETVFEPSDKALQWINYEKAPAVSTIATVKGRKIVRIEYSEPRSFEKTVGMVMLAVETAKGSEWFAPFFAAQPESFRGQFVSGPDVALGYITTLEYSGTGAFRTHHLFELGGDHPRLVRTLQAGRVVRNEFNSDAEYEEALKIYEEEDDLFSGILKAEALEAMKSELKKLLNRLDSIMREHEEVGDTDVREQMYAAIHHGFIVQTPGYALPAEFGMFEPASDAAVRAALAEFIPAAVTLGISAPPERFAAFQDSSVRSDSGSAYDEYFGHADSFDSVFAAMSRPSEPVVTPPAKPWWQFWK